MNCFDFLLLNYKRFSKLIMNSSKNSRHSRSRDRFAIKKSFPQIPYHHQQKTFDSMENQPYQSRKQSAKSNIEPEYSPQIQRKGSHINTLHQQYNNLKEQMQKFPNRSPDIPREMLFREKERSQPGFMQDENEKQLRSQSSQQEENYHKNYRLSAKRQMYSYSQLPKPNFYLDEDYSMHQNKRKHQANEAFSNAQKQLKQKEFSVSSANIYLKKEKNNAQSQSPFPNYHRNIRSRQIQRISPKKVDKKDMDSPQKSAAKITRLTMDKFYPIKTKLERFQMSISQNMDTILEKIEDLQKKHLSLDLYFQELRQSISYKKTQSNQNHEISYAKHRQYKFLMGQLQNKVKQLKGNNEKLQKQLVDMRINENQFKSPIAEQQRRIKQYQIIAQTVDKLKEMKVNTQKKAMEAQSKVSQLQRQKSLVEGQLQRLKKEMEMQQSVMKQQHNVSHLISNSTLFGSFDDTQYLKQQISKLQYENKEYQKLITVKSSQISNLAKTNTESKMMMEKIKEMNEQLQRQCSKLQRDIVQKQLEATEKICSLNNNIKKKIKQYDSFKDLIVQCLDQIYKKMPKKIRKNLDGDIINKNRTNKCETMFKGLNSFISYYQQQNSITSASFLKEFSISQIELQKIGIQECFKRIKSESNQSLKIIGSLKQQNKILQTQNASLKQEILAKSESINAMAKQQEQQNMITNKLRLQSLKKDIPTSDAEPKQSFGSLQQISKKKAEVEKLNKENNRLIEQSHQKYLLYQEQIAQLEIKQKQLKSKILETETDRNDFISKLQERESQIKSVEKTVSDLKVQKQGLTLKIAQINNENKRTAIEYQSKINKLSNENEVFKKKMAKWKGEQRQLQKFQQELRRKQQQMAINSRELSQKQTKISNINEEYKKILQQLNSLRQIRQKQEIIGDKIEQKQKIIRTITQQRIEINEQYEKVKKINEQYKRIAQQQKRQKSDIQKKNQVEKDKRLKQLKKLSKQLQAKQQEIANFQKQRKDEILISKDLEQKLSKVKIQNQELIRLIHKRQDEIQRKQSSFNEDKQAIIALQKKQEILQKELLQRQQYFKKSERLMQQLIKQNEECKAQLSKKQTEILSIIKQRQQLNFRLSEDLDAKNQQIQMTKLNHEHQIVLFKEKVQAMEMNLTTSRQQLRLKNGLVEELRDTINRDKKESTTTKQTRQQYETHLNQCRQTISNLNNKLDIMQEQLEETKIRLNDRQQQMNAAKRQKTKYYKILQEKLDYIDQLEEAVKIKCNQVDQMKEIQEEYQEARELYEQNEEKLKSEIQELLESIKQLQQKSIQQINHLKKEVIIYKEQAEELKEQVQKQKRNYRSKCKEKQQLAKEVERKDMDLVNLIKRYEQLKIRKNEQIDEKSYEYEQKMAISKKKAIQQRFKQQSRLKISKIQQEKASLLQRVRTLQKELEQKLIILESLNLKIQEMDSDIGDLELKLNSVMSQNAHLKSQRPRTFDRQEVEGQILQKTLQLKIKELDGKQYQLQQIKQQNKKALKLQLNEFNANLQSYRQQLNIVEKQLHTCQQINVVLTLKCESLQRQNKELMKGKEKPNNMILSPSPSHPDFASIDLGLPNRQILKHILSESWHNKNFELNSKVVDEVISIRFLKEEVVHHYEEDHTEICEESQYSWPSLDARERL